MRLVRLASRFAPPVLAALVVGACGGGGGGAPPIDSGSDFTFQDAPANLRAWGLFTEKISEPIVQGNCVRCHVAGGLSGVTALQFTPRAATRHARRNYDAISGYVGTSRDAQARILAKVAGAENHGGGVQLTSSSEDYRNLRALLYLLTGTVSNDSDPLGDFWTGVALLDNESTLRRAALLVAGRLASTDEQSGAIAGGIDGLKTVLRNLLQGDGFHSFLIAGSNDRLLTDKHLTGPVVVGFDRWPGYSNREYELTLADIAAGDADQPRRSAFRLRAQYGVARAPLELIAHVVENDKPYTEILTADYIMVNNASAVAFGSQVNFDDPQDMLEFKPGRIESYVRADGSLVYQFDQLLVAGQVFGGLPTVYPHAGILNTTVFLRRYPSTATNRNRARARWTYYHFLGVDIENSASRTNDPAALADKNNPTLLNPHCTVCHQNLDPVAGAFQNYGDDGFYKDQWLGLDSLPQTYKSAPGSGYQSGDTWYRDMRTPGLAGEVAPDSDNSLQWLAQRIVTDERFATAVVKFWWPAVFGAEPIAAPGSISDFGYAERLRVFEEQNRFIDQLATVLRERWNLKDVLVEMLMSPWFRATQADPALADLAALEYAGAGVERLLTPEQLEAKTAALTGLRWGEFTEDLTGRRRSAWNGDYGIMYGGIDSDGITDRATALTSVMAQVALAHAVEMSCPIVVGEFATPDGERHLFNNIPASVTPDWQGGAEFDVSGRDPSAATEFTLDVNLSTGRHRVKIAYLNDFYDPATNHNRDLIVDDVRIVNSRGAVLSHLEAGDLASLGGTSSCGDRHNSDDWNLWGNCQITLPFDAPVSGSYRVIARAYYREQNGTGAGPAQMAIGVAVADPGTQASTGARWIKEVLVELHRLLLNERLSVASSEIERSFGLLRSVWQENQLRNEWGHVGEEDVYCNVDFSRYDSSPGAGDGWQTGNDPDSMLSAWRAVLVYLLSDYRYLHE